MNIPTPLKYLVLVMATSLFITVGCVPKQAVSPSVNVPVVNKAPEAPPEVEPQAEVVEVPETVASDLPADPAVLKGTLENGLTYLVMKNSEPKGRVSMHLAVKSGSFNETDEEQGLAHYLEHMLFNGSENFPPGELIKYFQRIGMSFGGDANAHTGFFETVYDVVLQTGDKKSLAEGLLVMRDYAAGALLLESEVERERGVILAEKRDRDSISVRNQRRSLAFELPGLRINDRYPIGTEEVIRSADSALLKGYYDAWYRPETMAVVVVGDMEPSEAIALIKERFTDLAPRAPKRDIPDYGEFTHVGHKAFYAFNPEAGSTQVTVEVLRQHPKRSDSFETRKRQMILSMASQVLGNRLDDRIGKEGTPFTSAASGTGTFMDQVDYGILVGECEPGRWRETLFELDNALRSALAYGFTEAEVLRVKKEQINALVQAEKRAPTRNSRDLASMLVSGFTRDGVVVSPEDVRRLFEPVVEGVTPEVLWEALISMWNADHRLVLVEGNLKLEGGDEAAADKILSAYTESRQVAAVKPVVKASASFPYLERPQRPGRVVSITEPESLGVKVVTFDNGVVLNLKTTDYKKGEVIYALEFGRGLSRMRRVKPGMAALASDVMNESGLGKLTREETERALAGTNTGFAYAAGQGRFSISGSSTPEEASHLMQILYTMVTDTQLKDEAYVLSKKRFAQGLDELGRTVDGVLDRDSQAFFTGDLARFGYPDAKGVEALSVADVLRVVMPALETEPLELSIAGDFDEDAMIALCGAWLGALPKRVAVSVAPVSLDFPEGKRERRKVATTIDRAAVMVGWPTTGNGNISRTRRLSVLGGLFRERLRETVRETLGVAYSPSAWSNASSTYRRFGVMQALVTVSPDKEAEVIAAIESIAKGLRETPATEDELRRVVDPLVNRIADYRRTNGYWLNSVMRGSSLRPERFTWATTMMEDYASIDSDSLNRLARRYLLPGKEAVMVVHPDAP